MPGYVVVTELDIVATFTGLEVMIDKIRLNAFIQIRVNTLIKIRVNAFIIYFFPNLKRYLKKEHYVVKERGVVMENLAESSQKQPHRGAGIQVDT